MKLHARVYLVTVMHFESKKKDSPLVKYVYCVTKDTFFSLAIDNWHYSSSSSTVSGTFPH